MLMQRPVSKRGRMATSPVTQCQVPGKQPQYVPLCCHAPDTLGGQGTSARVSAPLLCIQHCLCPKHMRGKFTEIQQRFGTPGSSLSFWSIIQKCREHNKLSSLFDVAQSTPQLHQSGEVGLLVCWMIFYFCVILTFQDWLQSRILTRGTAWEWKNFLHEA